MNFKNFLFKHAEKFILCLAVYYLVYTAIHTFVTLNRKTHELDAKARVSSNVISRRLKTEVPPATDIQLGDAEQLKLRFTTPPGINLLQRSQLFSKYSKKEVTPDITTGDLLTKEPEIHPRLNVDIPGGTEFIYKGGTAELALIQVRKLYKEAWFTKSFVVHKGSAIGEKAAVKKEMVDFTTRCKLREIVPSARKPYSITKTQVLRDEGGNFLGTSLIQETHMVTASKIVFEYKEGKSYDLWIGELVNLGTDTATVRPTIHASITQ
ncbi:MAG: hypothetical protein E3K32_01375 [wastewater metagenome]|nr:hypothetical protein [Candidatus Loosdrechtia aerotolerans]